MPNDRSTRRPAPVHDASVSERLALGSFRQDVLAKNGCSAPYRAGRIQSCMRWSGRKGYGETVLCWKLHRPRLTETGSF